MNRREFVKALAGILPLGLLAKLPKAESDEWRETLIETTKCAYMTNGESVKFDPPVNAGTFIDLYREVGPYITLDEENGLCIFDSGGAEVMRVPGETLYGPTDEERLNLIISGDSEYDVTVGHGSRLPLFEDNWGISAQAVRARIQELSGPA